MTATVNILKNSKVFLDWMDLSGQENETTVGFQVDAIGNETWNQNAHTSAPGLQKFSIAHKGFLVWGTDSIEEKLSAVVGQSDIPLTLSTPGNAGDRAYFLLSDGVSLNRGIKVGALASFDMNMSLSEQSVIRGILLEDSSDIKSVNGTGTPRQLAAALSTQSIYGILHVLATTGAPTIAVTIESDNTSGFSSPVTVITFSAKTARGSQFAVPIAGPNTDTYYRAKWTISGGTATIAVAVGIL
jgi:hypothetical protein